MDRNLIAISVLAALFLAGSAAAQYGYGTSSIALNSTSGAATAGAGTSVGYTVNLASGNTWGTTLSVQNSALLSSSGITVMLSNPSGDPPFSGTASIDTSANTPTGAYSITFVATGDDPSSSPAVYTLTVTASSTTTVATTSGSTSGSTSTSTAPTSYSTSGYTTSISGGGYGSGGNATGYGALTSPPALLSILAIVVLFAVIWLAFKYA